ncbi:MAG: phosphohistidine phosphatase SixA [Pedobacter sp.]|jgi:phosphohistidine phosphatase SixA|nr:phosphohistidine phosphatase SixA [Pedobacter sp.]
MKKSLFLTFSVLIFALAGCSKKADGPTNVVVVEPPTVKITSPELLSELLFVNHNNYQVLTNEPASFSSTDTSITISSTGLISRLTSGEVVSIDVTSVATGKKSKLMAVGATDDNHVKPFETFHFVNSSDPYGQYVQGWETLKKLPSTTETYAIILRHGDADQGEDFSLTHPNDPQPANWWKSNDPAYARQLNEVGKSRSRDLGVIFKDLQYPIAKVYTSEFYRAIETATLMNLGKTIVQDGRLNHPSHNANKSHLFPGLQALIKEKAVDGEMILVSAHHPLNEFNNSPPIPPTFPQVSAFNWTGAYIVKIAADKSLTYQGAVSYPMFKYYRDLKLAGKGL